MILMFTKGCCQQQQQPSYILLVLPDPGYNHSTEFEYTRGEDVKVSHIIDPEIKMPLGRVAAHSVTI